MDNNLLEIAKLEARKILAKNDYAEYCKYVHKGNWILGKHLKLVCEEVEKLLSGEMEENILIISMPPQHGKSQCVTETLPSYYISKNPDKNVMVLSYGDDLANRFGRKNKQKISEYGYDLFGVELDRSSDSLITIKGHSGQIITGGIMAGVTGNPADLIILDDCIKNKQEADSEIYRNRMWEEYLSTVNTRKSATAKVIVIMTRWHEDDLAGRIIKNEPTKCKVINIPLEAEENDILGRKPGDALFPEIGKDNNWLKDFKKIYTTSEGSRTWYAMMQGRPTAQEGNLFKREWFKYYEKFPNCPLYVMSVDATFKDTSKSDFVAIGVWGKRNEEYYLIDLLNKRMGFVDTLAAVQNMKNKHKYVSAIYIEDKANGSAIIDVLRRKISGVVPFNPGRDSKESRASSVSPLLEAGQVYIPKFEGFVGEFIEQCCQFPNGTNDDMVDQMVIALSILRNRRAVREIKEEYDPVYGVPFEDEYQEMIHNITGGKINEEMFQWR